MQPKKDPANFTQEEVDPLLRLFRDHMDTCPDFAPSDVAALAEVAEVWKIIRAIRTGGKWLGNILIRYGSLATAAAVLFQYWRGGAGK